MRIHMQPCGDDCVERNYIRPPNKSQHQLTRHVSEPPWKWMLWPRLSFEMTAVLALEYSLMRNPELDSKPSPDSWPIETARSYLLFYITKSRVVFFYTALEANTFFFVLKSVIIITIVLTALSDECQVFLISLKVVVVGSFFELHIHT